MEFATTLDAPLAADVDGAAAEPELEPEAAGAVAEPEAAEALPVAEAAAPELG